MHEENFENNTNDFEIDLRSSDYCVSIPRGPTRSFAIFVTIESASLFFMADMAKSRETEHIIVDTKTCTKLLKNLSGECRQIVPRMQQQKTACKMIESISRDPVSPTILSSPCSTTVQL